MGRLIFDFLYSKGIHGKNILKILSCSEKELNEIVIGLIDITKNNIDKNGLGIKFFANKELSGAPFPCSSFDCRLGNVNHLNIISALYSDEMWIVNPFERYLEFDMIDNIHTREEIIGDIMNLYSMRPLIENGLIKLTKSKVHLCTDCFHKFLNISPNEHSKNLDIIYDDLVKVILKNTDFYVKKSESSDKEYIHIKSNLKGVSCNKSGTLIGFKDDDKIPDIYRHAFERKSKRIYKKEIIGSGLVGEHANRIVDELAIQEIFNSMYGTNYISNRELDERILRVASKISKDQKVEDMLNHLRMTLPYIGNSNVESIVNLRQNEGEAFLNYREAVKKLTTENKNLPVSEMKEFINDEIDKEVLKIEATIKRNKKFIKSEIGKNIFLGSLVFSFASFNGVVPEAVKYSMTALGAFHPTKEFIDNAKKLLTKDYGPKNNNFYFIFKLRK